MKLEIESALDADERRTRFLPSPVPAPPKGGPFSSPMITVPAWFELATILRKLPDYWRTGHRILDIQHAYTFGYADKLWPKQHAAWLAFRANSEERMARGKGKCAERRAKKLLRAADEREAQEFAARMHEERLGPMTDADFAAIQRDADQRAEQRTESRSMAHHYRTHFHE